MDYLLDSNIVIIYSRDNEVARRIEEDYKIIQWGLSVSYFYGFFRRNQCIY